MTDAAKAGASVDSLAVVLEAVRAEYSRKDFEQARRILSNYSAGTTDSAEIALWECRILHQLSEWQDLLKKTTLFLNHAPEHYEVLLLRARAANAAKEWKVAGDAWGAVAAQKPEWAEAWFQFGRSRGRSGDSDGLQSAMDVLGGSGFSNDATAVLYLARLFLEFERLTEARTAFAKLGLLDRHLLAKEFDQSKKASDIVVATLLSAMSEAGFQIDTPKKKLVCGRLSQSAAAQERAGNLVASLRALQSLAILDPGDPIVARSIERITGALLWEAHNFAKAEDWLNAREAFFNLAILNPQDIQVLTWLGRAEMKLKNWPRSIRVWQNLLALNPAAREPLIQLARACDRSGRISGAKDIWLRLLEIDPDNAEAKSSLSSYEARLTYAGREALSGSHLKEAWVIFRELARSDDPRIATEATRRMEQIGRSTLLHMGSLFKEARFYSITALHEIVYDLLPKNSAARLHLARAAMQVRDYNMSQINWREVRQLDENSTVTSLLQEARCFQKMQDPAQARTLLEQLLTRDPKNAQAQEMLSGLQDGEA